MDIKWVTILKCSRRTGYAEDVVREKISSGEWPQPYLWKQAPDGRIFINLEAWSEWVEGKLLVPKEGKHG